MIHLPGRHSTTRTVMAAAVVAAAAAAATPALADDPGTARWLNPVSGNWHQSANWSTHPKVPQSPDLPIAIIDAVGQPYTVTIGQSAVLTGVAVNRLVLDSPDATITTVSSPGIDASEIQVNRGALDLAQGERSSMRSSRARATDASSPTPIMASGSRRLRSAHP